MLARGSSEPAPAAGEAPTAVGGDASEGDLDASNEPIEWCVRVGPFEREVSAREVVEQLGEAGHKAHLEVDVAQQRSGYWVLIPPSEEDEDFLIANLELAGISDVWSFTRGELAGALSLGIYSDRERAEGRLGELRDKGFAAEIRPRHVAESVYWVVTTYPEADAVAREALESLYNQFPTLGFPPRACGDIATP
jgi:hypothetical protein